MHIESSHADNHAGDECSPLCNCTCCGSITIVHEISHSFKTNFTQLPKPFYSENSVSEISYSIWQPPKI